MRTTWRARWPNPGRPLTDSWYESAQRQCPAGNLHATRASPTALINCSWSALSTTQLRHNACVPPTNHQRPRRHRHGFSARPQRNDPDRLRGRRHQRLPHPQHRLPRSPPRRAARQRSRRDGADHGHRPPHRPGRPVWPTVEQRPYPDRVSQLARTTRRCRSGGDTSGELLTHRNPLNHASRLNHVACGQARSHSSRLS